MGVWLIRNIPIEIQAGYEDAIVLYLPLIIDIRNVQDNEVRSVDGDIVAFIPEASQIGIKIE
jgi:hypothetical protein